MNLRSFINLWLLCLDLAKLIGQTLVYLDRQVNKCLSELSDWSFVVARPRCIIRITLDTVYSVSTCTESLGSP